ncbi:MAG: carboxypeptidase regulatory-like domain-containing protein [Vicinamibacterales bacterium]
MFSLLSARRSISGAMPPAGASPCASIGRAWSGCSATSTRITSAFVVVFNHPYFQVTDADGRFRIDNVPPGTYTVVGWHEGEARAAQRHGQRRGCRRRRLVVP